MPLRPYEQDQMFLLPPSLNEWVRDDNPARVFSEIIDGLDTSAFRQAKDEGRPAYHPAGGENFKYLEDNKIDGYIPSEDERHIGSNKKQKAREHLFAKETLRINIHVHRVKH